MENEVIYDDKFVKKINRFLKIACADYKTDNLKINFFKTKSEFTKLYLKKENNVIVNSEGSFKIMKDVLNDKVKMSFVKKDDGFLTNVFLFNNENTINECYNMIFQLLVQIKIVYNFYFEYETYKDDFLKPIIVSQNSDNDLNCLQMDVYDFADDTITKNLFLMNTIIATNK